MTGKEIVKAVVGDVVDADAVAMGEKYSKIKRGFIDNVFSLFFFGKAASCSVRGGTPNKKAASTPRLRVGCSPPLRGYRRSTRCAQQRFR
jgi:hypothetical protein